MIDFYRLLKEEYGMSIQEIEETDYDLLTEVVFKKKNENKKELVDALDYFGVTEK